MTIESDDPFPILDDEPEPEPPVQIARLVEADEAPPPPRLMLNKAGNPRKIVANVIDVLSQHADWRGVLVWDDFALTVRKLKPPPVRRSDISPRVIAGEWVDGDTVRTLAWLQTQPSYHRLEISADLLDSALLAVAELHVVHPIREWLRALQWDGIERLPSLFPKLFGAHDTRLNREVGKRWLISAVARVMHPGCQCKYMPVLESDQDAGKSTGIAALVNGPDQRWFSDTPLRIGDKDGYQSLRAKWIHEWAELAAFRGAKDVETLKSFVSSQSDNFRASYGRRNRDWPRQCVFIGSTNEERWLSDPTGGSRFWPIRGKKDTPVNVALIAALRPQLWAEAFTRFEAGERWWIDPHTESELLADARSQQKDRTEIDPWIDFIKRWLERPSVPVDGGRELLTATEGLTSSDILSGALDIRRGDATRAHSTRLGYVMREIGFERSRIMRDGDRHYRYFPHGSEPPAE